MTVSPSPRFANFAEKQFTPYIVATFGAKPKTISYYDQGAKSCSGIPNWRIRRWTRSPAKRFPEYAGLQREAGYQISSVNPSTPSPPPDVPFGDGMGDNRKIAAESPIAPGETRRERVLTDEEEAAYLNAAQELGDNTIVAYERALEGIRATQRGEEPLKPRDPYILRDIATTLLDCGLRPEECFRLRRENVRDGAIEVHFGKTANARRRIPMSDRVEAIMRARLQQFDSEWVFPAPTKSGHAEPSTIKRHQPQAIQLAGVERFVLYALCQTCLTRWASHMDPYTLAFLAGHSDFSTTKRYVHPQIDTVRTALERARSARGSTRNGQSDKMAATDPAAVGGLNLNVLNDLGGASRQIRTADLLVRSSKRDRL